MRALDQKTVKERKITTEAKNTDLAQSYLNKQYDKVIFFILPV